MDRILRGGISKVKEAGAIIAGGHTIADPTPKYGLCVTGFMRKDEIWSNKGAKPGDCVVLTKALGVGIVNTASKGGEASEASIADAVDSMTRLNKNARDIARKYDVHAATDVTGFSLAGHSQECAAASNVTIEYDTSMFPIIEGALGLARFGMIPEGRYTNEDYLFDKVRFSKDLPQEIIDLAYDPQTSGGLLLFMPEQDAQSFVKEFSLPCCRIIGKVSDKKDKDVIFI